MKHAHTIYCFSFRHYAWYLCGRRSQGLSCVRYCWIYYTNSPSVFSHTLCTYCIYCIYVFMYCLWANGLRNKWTWTLRAAYGSFTRMLIELNLVVSFYWLLFTGVPVPVMTFWEYISFWPMPPKSSNHHCCFSDLASSAWSSIIL